jgi:phosphoserine phosphatase
VNASGWPSNRRLLLMRHGETYAPLPDTRLAGPDQDPSVPLTERGRERVREVAAWMAPVAIDAAYSSSYDRSRETAELVAAPHGLGVTPVEALRELALYPPPGGTLIDVARRYLTLVRDLQERPASDVQLDCGRSLAEIVDAALGAIRSALERSSGTVLVVAHGGINRFLLGHWLGMAPARAIAIEQNFACVNVVEFARGGHAWVRALNCTLHDPLKLEAAGI